MKQSIGVLTAVALMTFLLVPSAVGGQNQQPMGFFITSVGPGDGANLGGREGADRHLSDPGGGCGCGEPNLARVPEHPGGRGAAGGARTGSDR